LILIATNRPALTGFQKTWRVAASSAPLRLSQFSFARRLKLSVGRLGGSKQRDGILPDERIG
jgi:hypothetical protein